MSCLSLALFGTITLYLGRHQVHFVHAHRMLIFGHLLCTKATHTDVSIRTRDHLCLRLPLRPHFVHTRSKDAYDMCVSRGGDRGSGSPWKITKLKGFFAILVRIPLKVKRLPSQHSLLSHHRSDSETPFYSVSLAGR